MARSGKPRKARCAPEPQNADRLTGSPCQKQIKQAASTGPAGALAWGECEERAGRLVEASNTYEAANFNPLRDPFFADAPTKAARALQPTFARLEQRASALASRIPQIRFQVHGASPTVLWIDDDPVAIGTLSGSYRVNPGKHHVVASGPDGRFEETFSLAEGTLHTSEVTLGEPPQDWPRWIPHDDLECRLEKMLTYPQARDTSECDVEKAAALGSNTAAEALTLGSCYERAKLFPLACSAFIEASLRHPAKQVTTMPDRYSVNYLANAAASKPTKEMLDFALVILQHRARVCPRGW